MSQPDQTISESSEPQKQQSQNPNKQLSKHVSDHLANERTFLAWIRTGLATITFGFVVARFGLLLRELDVKHISTSAISLHYSSILGVSLTLLGVLVIAISLIHFLRIRREIDAEQFHPQANLAIIVTILVCLIGITLALYLFLTA